MILRGILFIILLTTSIKSFTQVNKFYLDQEIATNGANDSKFFIIDGENYIAVAEFQDNNTVEINSAIYKWSTDSLKFLLFQEIATLGASDWEYFEISGESYLAIANYRSENSFTVNSVIYKWNGSQFTSFQEIQTQGAYDWEYFEIADTLYLAVANQDDGSTNDIDSKIYKWDGILFQEIQSIATEGATDWEAFTINNENYIAIANVFGYFSKIYKWNGNQFTPFQTFSLIPAFTGIESFEIDNEMYLAISIGYGNGFEANSKIYKWNGNNFSFLQDIPCFGAFDFEYFFMNNEHYLSLANYQKADYEYNQNSEILKWNGTEFENFQNIFTHAAVDFEYFKIEQEAYIMISEYKDSSEHNINSRIFKYQEPDTIPNSLKQNVLETFEIYPNPTTSIVYISNESSNKNYSISLFNSIGKKVFSSTNISSIDLSKLSLSKGKYYLNITSNNEVFYTPITYE